MKKCLDCVLCKNNNLQIEGVIQNNPTVMWVLDRPDADEMRKRIPFTGRRHTFLLNMMSDYNVLDDMVLTYAVKCRSVDMPSVHSIDKCFPRLKDDVLKTNPKLIVLFGASVVYSFFGYSIPLHRMVNRFFNVGGHIVYIMYNPIFASRDEEALLSLKRGFNDIITYVRRKHNPLYAVKLPTVHI